MISKAKSIKGSVESIDYIMNDKELAEELDRNLVSGLNPKEIFKEFKDIQFHNTRCKNKFYSMVLSPSNEKEFSKQEMKEITRKHLKNLGLENNQYLAYLHKSTDQPHVHLIINRISLDGKTHNDSFISKKAQTSAHNIAKELGLSTAQSISVNNLRELIKGKKKEKKMQAELLKQKEQKIYRSKRLSL